MISAWGLQKQVSIVAAMLLLPQLACAGSFNLGSISRSPVGETKKFWPLASYLARQLQSQGIDDGRVVVAESIPAMSSLLQARQVDLYIDSFFPSAAVSRLSGSKLLLRRWKMGIGDYTSVIFTRKDNSIARLEDLKGKVIAFEEPFSSSGYFFPKIALLKKGLRLVPDKPENDRLKSDKVTYVFTQSDSRTIFMVLNGTVAAGAIDNKKYQMSAENLASFKIIHESVAFPRQIVSHRADLAPALVTRVKELLLSMPHSEEGRKALQAFENSQFDEIPPAAIGLMTRLRKYVDAELKLK